MLCTKFGGGLGSCRRHRNGRDIRGTQEDVIVSLSKRFITVANRVNEHFDEGNDRGSDVNIAIGNSLEEGLKHDAILGVIFDEKNER